ncbi:MAG: protein kinase [Actinobacteria bacterium]|uniref:Unannotated protein n=1 Tax=freshwater metagenome TaxID=449393 RepID=A0A6J6NWN6_9ZZZZ|nr:protein kinase [Actinomycetota bacterium]
MGYPKVDDEYAGRYLIVRQIGYGGMGVVFEAIDKVLNRAVAIKVVMPSLPDREDYAARFANEASVLARIRSRNIVQIHEYGEDDDTVYFVTELFPDGDLRSWLDHHDPFGRREALALVADLCGALADAHAAGVVHRDVKPANVLLWQRDDGLFPYLADFGIAVEGPAEERQGLTRPGGLVGSPAYMAPERHRGQPADEVGDVYSAGCVLWAVLTGQAPYSGTDFEVISSHVNGPVPQLGTGAPVDRRIDEVLAGALHKDPAQRIATAGELRERLLRIVADLDSGALPLTAPPPARKPDRKSSRKAERKAEHQAGHKPVDPPSVPPPPPESTRMRSAEPAAEPATDGTSLRSVPPVPVPVPVPVSGPVPVSVPVPGPGPTPAPQRDDQTPSARRWFVPALVLLLVLVLGGAAIATLGGDDDPAPSADPSASPSISDSPSVPVDPTAAGEPQVAAEPGYRQVTFTVRPGVVSPDAPEGATVTTEVRDGDDWVAVDGPLRRPTPRGGERACVTLRSLTSYAATSVPGEPTTTCAQSQPPTVSLVRSDKRCVRTVGGTTYPCTSYSVRVAGFETGTRPLAEILPVDGEPWCRDDSLSKRYCRTMRVDADGRASIDDYFAILVESGEARLRVSGVLSEPVRLYCGQPCR